MAEKRCYYEVLSVTRTATEVEITKAYRVLAKQYHPDRNTGDDEAKVRYAEVDEAYAVLNDAGKRARYDRHGHAGVEGLDHGGAGAPDVGDFFGGLGGLIGDFLDGMGGGRGRRGPRRGEGVAAALEVELLEAATGVRREYTVTTEQICRACAGGGAKPGTQPSQCRRCRGQRVEVVSVGPGFAQQIRCRGCGGRGAVITDPCPACRGAGREQVPEQVVVTVPPGVDDDTILTYPGRGHAGDPGAPRGDLEFHLRVRRHKAFERDGHHLRCECRVSFARAALGGPVEIGTLTGEKVTFEVPRASQTHTVVRVPGHGMPARPDGRRASEGKGDLLVRLIVETPTKLTAEQEDLFRRLAELENAPAPGPTKGIFGKLKDRLTGETPPKDEKK